MSNEVLQVVKNVDMKSLEIQMALQCAPLLSGLKISNLLKISKDRATGIESALAQTCISYFKLYESREKVFFLLYKERQLREYISMGKVVKLLRTMGYEDFKLKSVLNVFRNRYRIYMNNEGDFPHEMGILFGYPVEDVTGFIDNKGKNFLHCGYWKVYDNVEEKIELFQRFQRAEDSVVKLVVYGLKINQITELFKYNNKLLNVAV